LESSAYRCSSRSTSLILGATIQGVGAMEIIVVFDRGVDAADWRGGWFNTAN
jgi:hypothetical protein